MNIRGVIKTKPENVNTRQTVKVRENFTFKELKTYSWLTSTYWKQWRYTLSTAAAMSVLAVISWTPTCVILNVYLALVGNKDIPSGFWR
jgi:hypothetical protein